MKDCSMLSLHCSHISYLSIPDKTKAASKAHDLLMTLLRQLLQYYGPMTSRQRKLSPARTQMLRGHACLVTIQNLVPTSWAESFEVGSEPHVIPPYSGQLTTQLANRSRALIRA